MATFRLRRFTHPETLQAISADRLRTFLAPFGDYLASRGATLADLDYEKLIDVFMSPDTGMPGELIDALCCIDEISTPEGMDALLEDAGERGLNLDKDSTPIDVAVQVWLFDKEIVRRRHAEQYLWRRRSFEYYQTGRTPIPPFRVPAAKALQALEQSLDDWFEAKHRGRESRVFVYPRDDGVWFLVRHGEPYKREESLDGSVTASVCYRPLRFDVVVYQPEIGEIRINASTKGEKRLYCTAFGKHLFGDANFFPGTNKYTLEPLRKYGEASLNAVDVEGIEWIKLKEIHYCWGGSGNEIEVCKADDVFAALEERRRKIPERPRIVRAVFQVRFTDSRTPRSVTIRPSNIAIYTRDADSILVEHWLAARGFILDDGSKAHEVATEVLAGA